MQMTHLHVKVSAVLGEGHVFQGSTSCLAHKLPWDQVAVVLCNADQHLHAHNGESVCPLKKHLQQGLSKTGWCRGTTSAINRPHLIPRAQNLPPPTLRNQVDSCCGICCEDYFTGAACVDEACNFCSCLLICCGGLQNRKAFVSLQPGSLLPQSWEQMPYRQEVQHIIEGHTRCALTLAAM